MWVVQAQALTFCVKQGAPPSIPESHMQSTAWKGASASMNEPHAKEIHLVLSQVDNPAMKVKPKQFEILHACKAVMLGPTQQSRKTE